MPYSNIAFNLSDKNTYQMLYKPKARYIPEEEINPVGSPSIPRPAILTPEMHLLQSFQNSHGIVSNPFRFHDNYRSSCLSGLPHLPVIDGNSTRLSSSINPYKYEYRPLPLSPMVHPYYYMNSNMKCPPHFSGYGSYCYSDWRRAKRVRTAFTKNQLLILEKAFATNHYVVGSERKHLAQILDLSETQVKVWFQNRRTRHKREKQDDEGCSQKTKDKDCLNSTGSSSNESSLSDDDDETGSCKTSDSSKTDYRTILFRDETDSCKTPNSLKIEYGNDLRVETSSCKTSDSPKIDNGFDLLRNEIGLCETSNYSKIDNGIAAFRCKNSPVEFSKGYNVPTTVNTIWNPITLNKKIPFTRTTMIERME